MKTKRIILLLASLLAVASLANAQEESPTPTPESIPEESPTPESTPTPTPAPTVQVDSGKMQLTVRDLTPDAVEVMRSSVVSSGLIPFPAGLESRPVLGITLALDDATGKFDGTVTLGPAPTPLP